MAHDAGGRGPSRAGQVCGPITPTNGRGFVSQDQESQLQSFAQEALVQVALLGFVRALDDDLIQLGRRVNWPPQPCSGATFEPPA